MLIEAGRYLTEASDDADGLSDDVLLLIYIFGGLGGLIVLAACFVSFLPAGLVGVWLKVKCASTDPADRCFYLPRETKARYKGKLAERPPGCCAFFRPARPPKGKAARPRPPPLDIEEGDDGAAAGPEQTISGKALGLIPPASPTSKGIDLEQTLVGVRNNYEKTATQLGKLRHHRTTMLPLDLDDDAHARVVASCGFVGFGAADNHDEGPFAPGGTGSDDALGGPPAPFLFALLNDRGGWMVDLPLAADGLLLGKNTPIGRDTKLGGADVGTFKDTWFKDTLAIEQCLIAVAGGVVTATRVGPNASFVQKAVGGTHEPPCSLAMGAPAALAPGDLLWLCAAHYPLRLIERLPGPFFQARPMGGGGDYTYPTDPTGGGASMRSLGSSVGEPVAEASTQPLPAVGVEDVDMDNATHSSDV